MTNFFRFLYHIFRDTIGKEKRFVRFSPNQRGAIYFLDKKKRRFFSVKSRSEVDSRVADQIYTRAEYDFTYIRRSSDITKRYEDAIAAQRTCLIVDCGANIGLSARFFADAFPEAKVIALEPERSNYEAALLNCKAFVNIDIRNCAVGSTGGFAEIFNPEDTSWAFRTKRVESVSGIQVVSIQDILNEFDNAELLVVKIDIEGFEDDLFSENTAWVGRCFMLIIELHDWLFPREARSANFLKTIAFEGRDFVFQGENVFSISNRS